MFVNELLLRNNSQIYPLNVVCGAHMTAAYLGSVTEAVKHLLRPSLWTIPQLDNKDNRKEINPLSDFQRLSANLGASQEVLVVKNPPADACGQKSIGLIPGSGRSPGGGYGNTL